MLGDGAEGATAEAAAHDVDREADHFPGRDLGRAVVFAVFVGVGRVRAAGVRQIEGVIHLGRGQRNRRRVDPHVARGGPFAVRLHQRAGIAGVGFQVQHAVGVGVEHGVAFHLLVAGQADHAALARQLGHAAGAHRAVDGRCPLSLWKRVGLGAQVRVLNEANGLGCGGALTPALSRERERE
ncbi:hypothetical protein FQZ97_1028230 [compost metagenome]